MTSLTYSRCRHVRVLARILSAYLRNFPLSRARKKYDQTRKVHAARIWFRASCNFAAQCARAECSNFVATNRQNTRARGDKKWFEPVTRYFNVSQTNRGKHFRSTNAIFRCRINPAEHTGRAKLQIIAIFYTVYFEDLYPP